MEKQYKKSMKVNITWVLFVFEEQIKFKLLFTDKLFIKLNARTR